MNFCGSGNSFDRKITDSGLEFIPIYKQGSVSYSLESICSKLKIVPENIKIDVDGNELKVINGMLNILDDKNLKSICVELNPNFNEHSEVVKILGEYFNDYKKFEWYNGQEVFNYIFKR